MFTVGGSCAVKQHESHRRSLTRVFPIFVQLFLGATLVQHMSVSRRSSSFLLSSYEPTDRLQAGHFG